MSINDYMILINDFVINNIDKFLLVIIILSIFILIAFIRVNLKLSKMTKRYKELMQGVNGSNLEELLLHQSGCINKAKEQINELKAHIAKLEQESRFMIKKVHSKRYNAFQEMGSDLSFSVVFLNENNTGLVLTSIYGRDENRIYLKPIFEGKSEYQLSPEEKEVISKAIYG